MTEDCLKFFLDKVISLGNGESVKNILKEMLNKKIVLKRIDTSKKISEVLDLPESVCQALIFRISKKLQDNDKNFIRKAKLITKLVDRSRKKNVKDCITTLTIVQFFKKVKKARVVDVGRFLEIATIVKYIEIMMTSLETMDHQNSEPGFYI